MAFIVEKCYNGENHKMNDGYEIIKEFECCGKNMIIVRITNATHVMTLEEWHLVFGRWHPERWEKGKRKTA